MAKTTRKIGVITHALSGITVDYYIDGTIFRAEIFDRKFSSGSASILEEEVRDFLEHWVNLEWHGVIEVELDDCSGGSWRSTGDPKGVSLKFSRHYVSRSPAGRIVTCDWDVEPEHRKAHARRESDTITNQTSFPLTAPLKLNDKVWIAYDDQIYESLEFFRKALADIHGKIHKLISTKAGNKALTTGGQKLLT